MPTFVYKDKNIHMNNLQCIQLELILNLSDESRQFIKLGDKLYDAGIYKNEYCHINIDEYNWIQENTCFLH